MLRDGGHRGRGWRGDLLGSSATAARRGALERNEKPEPDGQSVLVRGARAVAAVAFVGWSGAGKTTLIERLVRALQAQGLRAGYLKGSCGDFEIDRQGKDSDRLFRAGAERVLIASPDEAALRFHLRWRDVHSLLGEHFAGCDLVLVEGFRSSDLPKIEVCRGEPLLSDGDSGLVAVVSGDADPRSVPRFRPEEIDSLASFVAQTAGCLRRLSSCKVIS